VIRGTKEKLVPWVTKVIKVRWECKERLENQVIQEAREKLEKGVQLVFQEKEAYRVIKEFVEIRVIKVKEANKEKEDYRVNRVSVVIAANKVKRDLLVRRVFRVIRDPEETRASVVIKGQMVILVQSENQDYKENQVKKGCLDIGENKVTRDREDIGVS